MPQTQYNQAEIGSWFRPVGPADWHDTKLSQKTGVVYFFPSHLC